MQQYSVLILNTLHIYCVTVFFLSLQARKRKLSLLTNTSPSICITDKMATSSESTGSDNLNDRLTGGLMMFLQLYDQQKDVLWQASGRFTQAAVRVSKTHKTVEDPVTKALFGMFGGTVGAVCGVVNGGIWGALGAIGTATSIQLFESVNVASVTVGFFGSVLGGVVGGGFTGAIGSAVNVVAHVSGHPVYGVISSAAWFTVGFVIGGAIGSTFGGLVGAAGGALGGGLGAENATIFSRYLLESMIDCPETNEKEKLMEKKEPDSENWRRF